MVAHTYNPGTRETEVEDPGLQSKTPPLKLWHPPHEADGARRMRDMLAFKTLWSGSYRNQIYSLLVKLQSHGHGSIKESRKINAGISGNSQPQIGCWVHANRGHTGLAPFPAPRCLTSTSVCPRLCSPSPASSHLWHIYHIPSEQTPSSRHQ